MKIQSLQIFTENLISEGFVLETRAVREQKLGKAQRIEIGDTGPFNPGTDVVEGSVNYYLEVLKQDRFSWLLFDASFLQVSYHRQGDKVIFHRYCYVPAPFEVDLRQESIGELADLIEGKCTANPLNESRRAMLRFEYDPAAQTSTHPAAHLHLNQPQCRIPMRSPFSVREFVFFLLKYFYSDQFDAVKLALPSFPTVASIAHEEEKAFHLNWRSPAPAV